MRSYELYDADEFQLLAEYPSVVAAVTSIFNSYRKRESWDGIERLSLVEVGVGEDREIAAGLALAEFVGMTAPVYEFERQNKVVFVEDHQGNVNVARATFTKESHFRTLSKQMTNIVFGTVNGESKLTLTNSEPITI